MSERSDKARRVQSIVVTVGIGVAIAVLAVVAVVMHT